MLITNGNAMMGTVYDNAHDIAMQLSVGDCLAFGSFVPSFDSFDVPVRLPMLWHVIDKQGSRLKLLSYFFFEHTGYWPLHGNSSAVTWKETDIRHNLNNTYFNDCFSEREREAILTTEVKTKTYDSSIITTSDKLFLPALEDIENILEHLKIGRGVYANCFDDDIPSVELLYCFYWLRDPGEAEDENLVVQGYADSKLVIDSLDHNADKVGVSAVSADCLQLVKSASGKTVDELAREVINGKWGNGAARKKLTAAGYDYDAVQKRANELMK